MVCNTLEYRAGFRALRSRQLLSIDQQKMLAVCKVEFEETAVL
jgi:hypothetical protein